MIDQNVQDSSQQQAADGADGSSRAKTTDSWPQLVRFGGSLLLVCLYFALITSKEFYFTAMISVFFALALLSAVIVHFRVRPKLVDAGFVALLSVLTGFLELIVLRFPRHIMGFASMVGISTLLVMGLCALWAKGYERKLLAFAFVPTLLFVSSEWIASTLLDITAKLHPRSLDVYLYSFDCSLRVQFSFLTGQLLAKWPWASWTAMLFYIALPLPIALVFAWKLVRNIRQAIPVMIGFLMAGPIGVVFYNIFPACGPAHLYHGGFPWRPIPTEEVRHILLQALPIDAPRNAIPSLHMAWILLVWWNSRRLPLWVRTIALAFVAWTIVATMGTGEHYFVDLVVAVPFALFIQALAKVDLPLSSEARRIALLVGLLETLLWLGLLSFAVPVMWTTPLLPWGLTIATIASCFWVESKLDGANLLEQSA